MSESFDEIMDYAAVVVADCDIPLLDRLKMAHDHELERRMREQYARGYEDGRRSMDAKHYAVALKLQDLTFDGSSHDNLSKIAYAVYPCATGWTCESSKGLRDELVRLLGGVGKPSGSFAKSADFGKSESVGKDEVGKSDQIQQTVTMYDVLDNERHKAVCRLREWEPDEDGMPRRELWEAVMGEELPTMPLKSDAELDIIMRDRLIHLLGGDEPTVMEYIQRIVREHDRRCLDVKPSGAELSQASVDAMSRRADQSHESSPMRQENETGITEELREKIHEKVNQELYVVVEADDLYAIADRIDEQFARVCER